MQHRFCCFWAHAEVPTAFNCVVAQGWIKKIFIEILAFFFNELIFLKYRFKRLWLCTSLQPYMEGLTQKRAAILNDTESSREGLNFVQVLLEWTTGSARPKPKIREAFHTWLCDVFCVWGFFGLVCLGFLSK